jgi:peptidyl-prolyl cis-trans isomerase SurA
VIRRVLVAVLAVLALAGTAGCQTHAGTAAYVGEHRITTTELDRSVASPRSGPRGEAAQNTLNVLVQTELLRRVAAKTGITVSDAFVTGAREDEQIRAQAAELGVSPEAFGTLAGYFVSIQNELARQVGGTPDGVTDAQVAEVQARMAALRSDAAKAEKVTVNPRYGKFDAEQALVLPAVEAGIRQLSPEPGAPDRQGQAPAAP